MTKVRGNSVNPRTERLRLLDGLRFVAALAVVVYHFTARTNPSWGVNTYDLFPVVGRFTAFGSMGVELFFVISGFVILMSAEGKTFRKFATSRLIRLYPAYWAGVLLTGGLLFFTGFETPSGSWGDIRLRGLLMNLTMVHTAWGVQNTDGVYWTLWIELLFYAMVGLLLLTGGVSRGRMLALALGWPLAGAILSSMGLPGPSAFLHPEYAPYFGVGICLYLIYRDGWRLSSVLGMLATSIFALWEAGTFMPGWIRNWTPLAPSPTGTTATAALIITAVAVVVLVPRVRAVNWRWLSVLGSLTYPLYVIHDIWGWWLISQIRTVLPVWPTLIAAVVLVIGMAAGIHYGVERPVARILRRWVDRDAAVPAGVRAGLPTLRRRLLREASVASPDLASSPATGSVSHAEERVPVSVA